MGKALLSTQVDDYCDSLILRRSRKWGSQSTYWPQSPITTFSKSYIVYSVPSFPSAFEKLDSGMVRNRYPDFKNQNGSSEIKWCAKDIQHVCSRDNSVSNLRISVQCPFPYSTLSKFFVLNKGLLLALSLSRGPGNVCVGIRQWSLTEIEIRNLV